MVQFHPQFVTEVDQVICPRCIYTEAIKNLGAEDIGVSPIPSSELAFKLPMPICTYSIRKDSPTGIQLRYATIGQPVYHVWACPSSHYGILVQNCYVDDEHSNNRVYLISESGCSLDEHVVETPHYNDDTTVAFAQSHVFKFADRTITRFTCTVKVCVKAGYGCSEITPPHCQNRLNSHLTVSPPKQPYRSARAADQLLVGSNPGNISTANQQLSLEDISNPDSGLKYLSLDLHRELFVLDIGQKPNAERKKQFPDNSLCFSRINFATFLAVFLVASVTAVVSAFVKLRERSRLVFDEM